MEIIDDIIKDFVHGLIQHWAGRRMIGGIFVKMQGVWHQAYHFRTAPDGSRYLRYMVCDPCGSNSSFHETYNGIEAIEG